MSDTYGRLARFGPQRATFGFDSTLQSRLGCTPDLSSSDLDVSVYLDFEVVTMLCPKCQSGSLSQIPAEIRLYRNRPRTLSHPPLTPSPEVLVCAECGFAEFLIPQAWLAAGWLTQNSEGTSPKPAPREATPIRETPIRETPVLTPARLAVVM